MTLELGKVQIRSRGHTLVGGNVALQPAARVRRIVRGSHADGVAEGGAPK